jgi:hypothetical protein
MESIWNLLNLSWAESPANALSFFSFPSLLFPKHDAHYSRPNWPISDPTHGAQIPYAAACSGPPAAVPAQCHAWRDCTDPVAQVTESNSSSTWGLEQSSRRMFFPKSQ